jgi:8-oxo-dGTP pyrophosphatase MutT (NUDIX family)
MEYTIAYAKHVGPNDMGILIVIKDRPEWQKDKVNLVGGKIEKGETPIQAAVRELEEESGLIPVCDPYLSGCIKGDFGIVHCVTVPVFETDIRPNPGETELVGWVKWSELQDHPALIPNLRVVIPLMMTGVRDWIVLDEGPTWDNPRHQMVVDVQSYDGRK